MMGREAVTEIRFLFDPCLGALGVVHIEKNPVRARALAPHLKQGEPGIGAVLGMGVVGFLIEVVVAEEELGGHGVSDVGVTF